MLLVITQHQFLLVIHTEVNLRSIEEMLLIHCLPLYGLSFYLFMVLFIR